MTGVQKVVYMERLGWGGGAVVKMKDIFRMLALLEANYVTLGLKCKSSPLIGPTVGHC